MILVYAFPALLVAAVAFIYIQARPTSNRSTASSERNADFEARHREFTSR